MIARAVALMPLLGACSIVYGADEPSDAHVVHGTYAREYATNLPDLTPTVATETFATGTIQLTAVLDDGTPAPVTYHDDGSFELARARDDQRYALTVGRNGDLTEYQLAQTAPHLVEHDAGRSDARPVTQPTPVVFDAAIELPHDFAVLSTGVWSQSFVPQTSAPFSFDWRGATFTGPPALLDASRGDALFLAEITTSHDALGYNAVTAALRATVTLVDGATVHVAGFPAALPPQCVTVQAAHAADSARLARAAPGPTTYAQFESVIAVPAPAEGLAGAAVMASRTSLTAGDEVVAMSFVDPLPGTTLVGDISTQLTSELALGASKPIALQSAVRYSSVVPATGACPVTAPVVAPVGLPGGVELAGTSLAPDASPDPIALAVEAGARQTLTWTSDAPVDVWVVSLFAVASTGGQTTTAPVRQIVTTDETVTFAPGTLVAGQAYVVRFVSATGFPDAASADFESLVYPISGGAAWTHVFEVTP